MGFEISGSTIVDQSRQLLSVGVITATSLDISGNVDVDGTLEADAITVNGSTLASVIEGTTVTNATNVAITDDTTGSGTHYLHFGSATSSHDGVEVDSTGLVYKNGHLGIGTDNPAEPLRVHKDGLNQLLQRWGGSQGATAGQRWMFLYTPETDSANSPFRFHTANAVKFTVDSHDALCIDSNGKVGMGTNTPMGANALTDNDTRLAVGIVTTNSVYGKLNNLTYPTADGTDGYVLTSDGAGVVQWEAAPGASGGIDGITIQEEGSSLSTLATTLNFVGDSVTASGTGATKTITITGGGGGGGASGLWASNATGINTSTNVGIATTTASAMLEIGNSGVATATTLINTKAWNGQTFNVDGNITSNSIFAVNDISGLPVIDYNASHGNLSLAPYGGNVSIGYTNSGTKLGLKGSTSERVYIVSNKLSNLTDHQINIDNGNVQYFSVTETEAISDVDITSNNTLNDDLAVGDSITVVAIIKPAADADKITGIQIDGTHVTEEWLGGSAPDGGASGSYDVYTFYILKTADATFIPFCNKVNFQAP